MNKRPEIFLCPKNKDSMSLEELGRLEAQVLEFQQGKRSALIFDQPFDVFQLIDGVWRKFGDSETVAELGPSPIKFREFT